MKKVNTHYQNLYIYSWNILFNESVEMTFTDRITKSYYSLKKIGKIFIDGFTYKKNLRFTWYLSRLDG
jgi:hypothetical protein